MGSMTDKMRDVIRSATEGKQSSRRAKRSVTTPLEPKKVANKPARRTRAKKTGRTTILDVSLGGD